MTQTNRRRLILFIMVVALGAAVVTLARHPVVRSFLVGWSDLEEIAPRVYLDPRMPTEARVGLLEEFRAANERIADLFGANQATPTIIAGDSMDVMARFGGNSYNPVGRTYLTALGAFIVLGPDGISSRDVIAHEMAHAELSQRIGHAGANALPDWMEEGIALQVDERFNEEDWLSQTENGQNAPSLNEIGTIQYDDWLGYATAKHEVQRWLAIVGAEGFERWLVAVGQGEDAKQSYQQIEAEAGALAPVTTPTAAEEAGPDWPALGAANLQVITVENAAQIRLLAALEIPGFHFVRETCGVVISPNGEYLAAACMSRLIPVWELATGELLYQFEGDQIWAGLAFSLDGKTLAAGGRGEQIAFWDLATGEQTGGLSNAPGDMNVLAFSPDGGRLAAGSFTGQAIIWDLATQDITTVFERHHSRVNSVGFSHDGTLVVSGGGDNLARVWDAETGEEQLVLSGANYFVEDVEFSPDDRFVAGAADDGVIRIWDASTGRAMLSMGGQSGPVNGLAYSPSGSVLASCGNDQSLRLWDTSNGRQLFHQAGHNEFAIRPAFSPDGRLIATVGWDGRVLLWGVPTG